MARPVGRPRKHPVPPPKPPDRDAEIAAVKKALTGAKRDPSGFVVSDQPSVTAQQFIWLTYRLETASDLEACQATYAAMDAPVDLDVVWKWREDAQFEAIYQECLANKREAFRYLGGQALPRALRALWQLLGSPSDRSKVQGLNLLLRSQGLLIDKVETHDPEAVEQLMAQLRERRPAQVIQGDYRQLPSGED